MSAWETWTKNEVWQWQVKEKGVSLLKNMHIAARLFYTNKSRLCSICSVFVFHFFLSDVLLNKKNCTVKKTMQIAFEPSAVTVR